MTRDVDHVGEHGMRVAHNLTILRQFRGLTFAQASDATGQAGRRIPRHGISLAEAGARRVDVDDLYVFAVAYQVPIVYLLASDLDLVASPDGSEARVRAAYETKDGWCACPRKPYQHEVTPRCGARPMPAPPSAAKPSHVVAAERLVERARQAIADGPGS